MAFRLLHKTKWTLICDKKGELLRNFFSYGNINVVSHLVDELGCLAQIA
jgi:hypothetical protein